MPSDNDSDGAPEHRGHLPPFTPPRFNWNQDNLYEQFKSFKQVVEFAFRGQYENCSNGIKCGSILNWWVWKRIQFMTICQSVRMTRRTLPNCWMCLNATLSQKEIFFSLGMHWVLYTVVHTKPSPNSITNSTVWPMTVTLQTRMK